LEDTVVYVEYQLFEERTGDEQIIIRLERPTEGIWTFTLFGDLIVDGRVDLYLPRKDFIKEETVFLQPDPYMTITFPATSIGLISTGAYNHQTGSLYLGSSRGLTRDLELKPNLVAPGVNVIGPLPGNRYGAMTGTSVSAAITAGAAALMLEWGINYGNDPDMDTQKVLNYLIAGATRSDNLIYPNREWGYGKLNLFGTFEALKGYKS
ncbi:MAG: S8 family serine peptidase, partial [Vallitaleaceae bacterium]|nr:S8 family serine peptidase [Vallitaleaceae bacterium]